MTVGRVATQIVLVVSALAIPTVLGVDQFGRYATVMAVVLTLEVFGSGGLHLAETRYVAPLWSSDPEQARTVASVLWTLRMGYSVAAAIAGWAWIASSGIGLDVAFAAALLICTRSALEATRQLFLSIGQVPAMMSYEGARAIILFAVVAGGHLAMELPGVLLSLAAAHAALGIVATAHLRRSLAVGFRIRHSQVAKWLRFGVLTLAGLVAWMAQAQVPIYLTGTYSTISEAATFAIVVQVYALGQALLIAPWSALMPVLSELHTRKKNDSMQWWARAAMNWGVAGSVVVACTWAATGDIVLRLLPEAFGTAHTAATWALVAISFLATTPATNGVLFAMGLPGRASIHQIIFAAITLVACWLVLTRWQPDNTGTWLAVVYLVASACFAALGYIGLRQLSDIQLRISEPAMLMLPLIATFWILGLEWPAPMRIGVSVIAALIYLGSAIAAGLLPTSTPDVDMSRS